MSKIFCLFFLFFTSFLFAEEAAPKRGGGYMQSLIMILIAVVFFYFILWRPEQRRRKAAQKRREALKTGDKITAMGILGTVDKIMDNTIVVKTYDGSKIEMLKAAVTDVQGMGEEVSSKKK
jgi:preprotein translocase subunit YajC